MKGLSCLLPRKSKDGKLYIGEREVPFPDTCGVSDFAKVRSRSHEGSSSRPHLQHRVLRTRPCYNRTHRGIPTRLKCSNTTTRLTDLLLSLLLYPPPLQPWTSTRKGTHPLRPKSPKSAPNSWTAPKRHPKNPGPGNTNFPRFPGIFG
jgi:hypothetical protein